MQTLSSSALSVTARAVLSALFFTVTLPFLNASGEENFESQTIGELLSELSPESQRILMRTLNEGDTERLSELPGIEKAKANIIIEARPLKQITELMLLPGFGEKTVKRIVSQAHFIRPEQDRHNTP